MSILRILHYPDPVLTTRAKPVGAITDEIRELEPSSMGEDMWPPFNKGALANPGFNHLNYYISGRYEWDTDQNIDDVLDEYFRLFYGPAAEAMKAFTAYYEQNQ